MAPSRGSYPGRARAPRRRTGWEVGPGGTTATTVSTDIVAILGSGVVLVLDGNTLVRLRGAASVRLNAATAIDDGFSGAIAVGIINEDAFAIGVSTIMDPLTDMDWDGWLYHRFFHVHADVVPVGGNDSTHLSWEVDSKAMRKLTDGDVVFAAMQVVETQTAVMQVHFNSRMLLKLP